MKKRKKEDSRESCRCTVYNNRVLLSCLSTVAQTHDDLGERVIPLHCIAELSE